MAKIAIYWSGRTTIICSRRVKRVSHPGYGKAAINVGSGILDLSIQRYICSIMLFWTRSARFCSLMDANCCKLALVAYHEGIVHILEYLIAH